MVEGARLESEYTAKPYRGFESLPLRHITVPRCPGLSQKLLILRENVLMSSRGVPFCARLSQLVFMAIFMNAAFSFIKIELVDGPWQRGFIGFPARHLRSC